MGPPQNRRKLLKSVASISIVDNLNRIVSLSLSVEDIKFTDDITDEELKVVSNAAKGMSKSELAEEKKKYRKVSGTLLDTTLNDHGFSLSSDALSFMENHYSKTKNVGHLHNFFKNHEYYDVEALMGRHSNLEHKKGPKNRIQYTSLLDRRHPLTDRADAFRSVSATIAHGDQSCSSCNMKLTDPDHDSSVHGSWHPVSNKAIEIETSFVTFPAYKSTSVEMSSFSSLMSDEIKAVFPPEADPAPPTSGGDGAEGDTDDVKQAAALEAAKLEATQKEDVEKAEYKGLLSEIKEIRDLRSQLREVD